MLFGFSDQAPHFVDVEACLVASLGSDISTLGPDDRCRLPEGWLDRPSPAQFWLSYPAKGWQPCPRRPGCFAQAWSDASVPNPHIHLDTTNSWALHPDCICADVVAAMDSVALAEAALAAAAAHHGAWLELATCAVDSCTVACLRSLNQRKVFEAGTQRLLRALLPHLGCDSNPEGQHCHRACMKTFHRSLHPMCFWI